MRPNCLSTHARLLSLLLVRQASKLIGTAGVCLLIALPSLAVAQQDSDTAKVVGYYPQWGVYGNFFINNLITSGSAQLLTHVNYAFAELQNNQCVSVDTWADYQKPLAANQTVNGVADSTTPGAFVGNFHQLQELKQLFPNLKISISIGGGSANPTTFSVAAQPANRVAFVSSCINMFIKGNFAPGLVEPGIFDGIDIDWEYPASNEDKANLTALLAEFRTQLDAVGKNMTLSIASSAGLWAYQYIDLNAVQQSLSFFDLMTYDFDGPWNATTGFVAPLTQSTNDPNSANNGKAAVEAYLAAGVAPGKIVFGIPFYGYQWTNVPDANHGLFEPGTPGTSAAYSAIVPLESTSTMYRDPVTEEPWLYDGTNFWTFDDPVSLSYKMAFVRQQRLGGVMAWDLSQDMPDGSLLKTAAWGVLMPPPPTVLDPNTER